MSHSLIGNSTWYVNTSPEMGNVAMLATARMSSRRLLLRSRMASRSVKQAGGSKFQGGTLQNRLGTKHNQRVGRPTVFSEGEEKLLVQTLAEVANWGYPLTQQDMKVMLKGYLDKRGRVEPRFKNNV